MRRRLVSWLRRLTCCPSGSHRDTLALDKWKQTQTGVPPTIEIYSVLWRCVDCQRRGKVLGETYRWLDEAHTP